MSAATLATAKPVNPDATTAIADFAAMKTRQQAAWSSGAMPSSARARLPPIPIFDPQRTLSCQARVTGAIDCVTDVTNSTKNVAKL
jgi:hypothetical protein